MSELMALWYIDNEGDSMRHSKWTVVALGEAQLDGGVGGQMNDATFDQRITPANPDGLDPNDNANNTFEQEVALKTWVDMAVDMLNRGATEQDVVAKLSHDGCPDPQQVVQLAINQPEQEANTDMMDGQQDPMAPVQDNAQPGMGSDSQLPMGVAAHVEWENVWGEKVAMPVEEEQPQVDPVAEIHSFLDGIDPAAAEDPASVLARIDNLKHARRAIRYVGANSKLNWVQAQQLHGLDEDTQLELLHLTASVGDLAFQTHDSYLEAQPQFQVNAFAFEGNPDVIEAELQVGVYSAEGVARLANRAVDAEIIASENTHLDDDGLRRLAYNHLMPVAVDFKNRDEMLQQFADAVVAHAANYRTVEPGTPKTASTENDADGPAEALFM
jgi:hypothetical protein